MIHYSRIMTESVAEFNRGIRMGERALTLQESPKKQLAKLLMSETQLESE